MLDILDVGEARVFQFFCCCVGHDRINAWRRCRPMFFCGYCRVKGGINELDEFAAQRKEYRWRKNLN